MPPQAPGRPSLQRRSRARDGLGAGARGSGALDLGLRQLRVGREGLVHPAGDASKEQQRHHEHRDSHQGRRGDVQRPLLLLLLGRGRAAPVAQQLRGGHVGELGEGLIQVGVALPLDPALVRPIALRRPVAVAAVEGLDRVHAGDNLPEGREALLVQEAVVAEVHEDLSGSALGARHRKGHAAALVRNLHNVVCNDLAVPVGRHTGIPGDTELCSKPPDHAEEARALEGLLLQ
mmetsp:Transcript_27104/g.86112  ORF Transcript_27104/g.86112 Transcript_27104/m.86112 type:complete len:233 (+) Transcript_27104:16-714(+)